VSDHLKGDKVRLRTGRFAGMRGTLLQKSPAGWRVLEGDDGRTVVARLEELTNYSLAARRAWKSMPDRKVGRPVGSKVSDRVSVTFRIDRDTWKAFLEIEASGLISDRTAVVNGCLKELVRSIAERSPSKL